MTPSQLKTIETALAENRLGWVVTGQMGEPCNGGDGEPIPMPTDGEFGQWQPKIKNAEICARGYHQTTESHRYKGFRVFLAEGKGLAGTSGDKSCWQERRALAEVTLDNCIDPKIFVRIKLDLQGADLQGAFLRGAFLQGAFLRRANLQGADLQGAFLQGAFLQGADLQGADLQGAFLQGAFLQIAFLQGADLRRAALVGVSFTDAQLAQVKR
jgi:uncharacterized protein YjbI with pentapeptide repeats